MSIPSKVLVTGHFRVLHSEHVKLFEFAYQFGKVIVGINEDYYHNKKYGDKAVPLIDRIYTIASCKFVDSVVSFNEETPINLIDLIRPNFYIKGPDYKDIVIPEQQICDELNIPIFYRPGVNSYSSSRLICVDE